MTRPSGSPIGTAREWAVPGATVYVTTHTPGRAHTPIAKGEVAKVTPHTFVVAVRRAGKEPVEHRFRFDTLRAGAESDGRVHLTYRQAHPADDPRVPGLIRAHNRYTATARARRRCAAWSDDPTPQAREDAIQALQALRQFDPPPPGPTPDPQA